MYMAVAGVKQKCLSIRFFFLVSFEEFYFLSGTHVIALYYRIFSFDSHIPRIYEFHVQFLTLQNFGQWTEHGFVISIGLPWPGCDERKTRADEMLVPIQKQGRCCSNYTIVWRLSIKHFDVIHLRQKCHDRTCLCRRL